MTSKEDKARARSLISNFLQSWSVPASEQGLPVPRIDLIGETADAVRLINEAMGEGEVSIRLTGAIDIRIQETVFAGVWRICEFGPQGSLVADRIEGGAMPEVVRRTALSGATASLTLPALPAGVMNSPALLHEIDSHMGRWRNGDRAYVVNLTLLPLSADDHALIDQVIAPGAVSMISRGFGNCRITSTTARNVWRVQYFNNLQSLILDTIEIVDMPEVALAADEDIADSRERIGELLAWMAEDEVAA